MVPLWTFLIVEGARLFNSSYCMSSPLWSRLPLELVRSILHLYRWRIWQLQWMGAMGWSAIIRPTRDDMYPIIVSAIFPSGHTFNNY